MGVVYYAKYFVWFEVARTEFFREHRISYRELEERDGVRLMLVDARCTYKSPATYDDLITVNTKITDMKNTSLSFSYEIKRGGVLIATGTTTHVFTNAQGRPIRIPQKVREALTVSAL
ncbi:MAG: hypothetical protein A2Z72_05185 [Omnitrophica bacterium RBG_13_46_9]|nr:MAG: hypothetical protein A2Z72_05185 [Omnitrophica bacterium RBG_13_46_9]